MPKCAFDTKSQVRYITLYFKRPASTLTEPSGPLTEVPARTSNSLALPSRSRFLRRRFSEKAPWSLVAAFNFQLPFSMFKVPSISEVLPVLLAGIGAASNYRFPPVVLQVAKKRKITAGSSPDGVGEPLYVP